MKTITEKNLEALETPAPDTKQHQVLLKKALLTSSYWDKKSSFREFFLKGGEEITTMKKFLSVGIIVTVMIVATLFIVFSPLSLENNNTQRVYAEQIAQASSQAVSNLTPSQLQALKQKLPADPDELLQEAKNAKDLQMLTYDQFISEYGNAQLSTGGMIISANGHIIPTMLPQITGAPTPETLDRHNLKFLQFTDANGDKVVMGINQSDLPVFFFGKGKDGSQFGAIRDSGKPGQIAKGQDQVAVSINGKGSGPVIMVNGKKYAVPASVTIVPGSQPPSIQIKNGNVYVNGVQATPEQ
jgi:hypothetical protein